ncbi:MAG: histidinol-phosphate transaminase [Oscillatoriales cyanobacterium RM2_1_1]|nr:histidinol-phosphate transaminase [Oscillatoriales cyanobacterium RM2_1_1]
MLPFIRRDLNQLQAYVPHPGGISGSLVQPIDSLDRLDTNECPYDLPETLKQKLAWAYQHQIETNRYPDGSHASLKIAISQYVNTNFPGSQASITPEQISVGNGSDELIRALLIATCLGGEGSILVANPTFSMYGILAETLGISVVKVNRLETDFSIDLEAATRTIQSTQTPPIRIVFVVHPNSPTANPLTPDELNWLRTLPEEILVVIDEAYFEFSQTSLAGELSLHPNWMILRTFSKAFRLAALRVGYGIAHPQFIAVLEKVRLPYNLPGFSQLAAEFALCHQAELLSVIPEILAQRQQLAADLAQQSRWKIWPSASNFLYIRPQFEDASRMPDTLEQFRQNLKSQGTLIRHTGGGLRITIGTPAENQRTWQRMMKL